MSKILLLIHQILFRLNSWHIPFIPSLLNKLIIRLGFGCQIGVTTKLGKGVDLGYGGLGVVIHGRSVIGDKVSIGTGVTIGGTNQQYDVPVIGDNSMIASGAKILGPIKIGKNTVIGANAVVLTDIPDNCVAVGIPAKIIKRDIDIKDYRSL